MLLSDASEKAGHKTREIRKKITQRLKGDNLHILFSLRKTQITTKVKVNLARHSYQYFISTSIIIPTSADFDLDNK